MRILIVDDNPLNQKILASYLKQLGYTSIVMANNGQEAVRLFVEAGPIHFIFMDAQMPFMNGYEASRQIRQQEKELQLALTPIICLTGDMVELKKVQEAGMNDFITKPCIKGDIQRMIETWSPSIQNLT
jgi:CheY-like chemotaxis protein